MLPGPHPRRVRGPALPSSWRSPPAGVRRRRAPGGEPVEGGYGVRGGCARGGRVVGKGRVARCRWAHGGPVGARWAGERAKEVGGAHTRVVAGEGAEARTVPDASLV